MVHALVRDRALRFAGQGIELPPPPVLFSKCAIESRGAQLKKFGRKTVSWRPLSAASVVYNHVDGRT
eukprot:1372747-Pleurochrysis_carterae.AAC.1